MNTALRDEVDVLPRGEAAVIKPQTFKTRLLRRVEIAEATMAFYFERPPGFRFRAGQAVSLTLQNSLQTDARGNRRTFSIASGPSEEELLIASRIRDSAFKRTLRAMAPGTAVQLRGPLGSFTLPPGHRGPVVMLAGGIGITPFVSMLRQDAIEGSARSTYLFYSNRSPATAAFLSELTALASTNPNLSLTATMTDTDGARDEWSGPRGFFSKEMLQATIPDLLEPTFYVAGPPQMVSAMIALLDRMNVPKEQIRTDEFFGY